MKRLIIGCGYLGHRVANLWLAGGDEVFAVTRSAHRARELSEAGIRGVVADVLSPASLAQLPSADTVLFAIGYDRDAGYSIGEVYVQGLRNALMALPDNGARFIYISSTGVYGQSHGDWVDESSDCRPVREGGRACLEAEQLLQGHPSGAASVILRMAGIYGPGRIPRRNRLQAGLPIAAPADGFLNLIHVDDGAQAVLAAQQRSELPGLYCVSDGNPVVRGQYYQELARLLGADRPRFEPPSPDASVTRRASSSKRVSNRRLVEQLGVRLRYPSYREGLRAILEAEHDIHSR